MEERARFGRIFFGSKEGICLLDAGGVVRAWNPALERITGHLSADLMDRVWSDVIVIRDHDENRLLADELVGTDPDEELELVTKTGPSRWVTTVSGPVGEAEGGGWVVLVRDVSSEHEIEAAKSDFLSTISHELRTPLTTIKGSLQVLARGRENLPVALADQMIGVTTRGAERLERLVMNLLAVSQIESGTMPVFPDELALEDVVHERVAAMLANHERVALDLPNHRVIVRADRERMAHVVEHLLENAVKFGGSEGQITIALERQAGYGRLSVTDEGPGIPARDSERIFERFVRLGDVLTRETQGAGVGLFIAKRSIEAMGGRIWVESEGARGSTFHVTVPLAHPVAVEDRDSA
jgi:PAS domain S-box-containing protein